MTKQTAYEVIERIKGASESDRVAMKLQVDDNDPHIMFVLSAMQKRGV